jgi:hypothetical protein
MYVGAGLVAQAADRVHIGKKIHSGDLQPGLRLGDVLFGGAEVSRVQQRAGGRFVSAAHVQRRRQRIFQA